MVFFLSRVIHEPLARICGATPSHVWTLINGLLLLLLLISGIHPFLIKLQGATKTNPRSGLNLHGHLSVLATSHQHDGIFR